MDQTDLIALPIRGSNIAPIFDFSPWMILVKGDAKEEMAGVKLNLQNLSSEQKGRALQLAGVTTIICGCISDALQETFEHCGIQVIWGITGPIENVLEQYRNGHLDESPYRVLAQYTNRFHTSDAIPAIR